MGFSVRFKIILFSAAVVSGFSGLAQAETLTEALVSAYRQNPTLDADRARQRATDENVPQALSGWRPTILATGQAAHNWNARNFSSGFGQGYQDNIANLNIALTQPLFRGFKTVEGTAQAEALVNAGRQQLLITEETVLLNGVSAYLNVLRDRRILELRQSNVRILQEQARATNERFKAGELTKTDVAQAQASLASSQAAKALAVANLRGSEANYEQIIGHRPVKLSRAPLAKAPESLDAAYSIAHQTNPSILQAAQSELASEHAVGVAFGALLPQASLKGSYTVNADLTPAQNLAGSGFSNSTIVQVEGDLTVPLYQSGAEYSLVRQAKQTVSQNKLRVIDAVRQVRQGVAAAWSNLIAQGQSVSANTTQVSASQLALNGVKQEYAVGSRSTIDVLNAQQTLLNAQIATASAQHDQLLASYQLQSSLGHLTAQHLHLGALYDPTENYNNVRNKWLGLSIEQ